MTEVLKSEVSDCETKQSDASPKPGDLAVCSAGRIGIIEGQKELPWGLSWVGRKLFPEPGEDSRWASRNPRVIKDKKYLEIYYVANNLDILRD